MDKSVCDAAKMGNYCVFWIKNVKKNVFYLKKMKNGLYYMNFRWFPFGADHPSIWNHRQETAVL